MHESNGDLSFKFRKVVLVISKSRFAEFVWRSANDAILTLCRICFYYPFPFFLLSQVALLLKCFEVVISQLAVIVPAQALTSFRFNLFQKTSSWCNSVSCKYLVHLWIIVLVPQSGTNEVQPHPNQIKSGHTDAPDCWKVDQLTVQVQVLHIVSTSWWLSSCPLLGLIYQVLEHCALAFAGLARMRGCRLGKLMINQRCRFSCVNDHSDARPFSVYSFITTPEGCCATKLHSLPSAETYKYGWPEPYTIRP
jgi:hypothetical protein